jgi:hypothetical protein
MFCKFAETASNFVQRDSTNNSHCLKASTRSMCCYNYHYGIHETAAAATNGTRKLTISRETILAISFLNLSN